MSRPLIVILIILRYATVIAQSTSLDSVVKQIYFGVDVSTPSPCIVDRFKTVDQLKYGDTVVRQWNLNAQISEKSKKRVETANYVFHFTESPLSGQKLESGEITARITESRKTKQLSSLQWRAVFKTRQDARTFFNYLKEKLEPVSTSTENMEIDGTEDNVIHSTPSEDRKEIKTVWISLSDSLQTNKNQIILYRFNKPIIK